MKDKVQEKIEAIRNEIIDAIKKEKIFPLREILENSMAELNFFDENDMSPLFYAIETHNIDIINFLLKLKADPYFSNVDGVHAVSYFHSKYHYQDPDFEQVLNLLTRQPQKISFNMVKQEFDDVNQYIKDGTMTVEFAVNIPSIKGYFQQLAFEEQHSLIKYMQEHDFVPDLLGIITSWESLA